MTFYDAHRLPLRILFTALFRVRVDGAERMPRTGPVVVISNHLTLLDPLLLGAIFQRQLHFMAKEELFRNRLIGWWLRTGGSLSVRRGETDRAAIRQAEQLLLDGEVMMLFPEGTRSGTGGAQAARAGAILLAARTGAVILPVAIAGTEAVRGIGVLRRPRVIVRVGEPFSLEGAGRGAGRKAAADTLMRRIVAMLPPRYHGIYAADATRQPEA